MQFKTHQDKLIRLQTSQNRDLEKGIILDRNERADSYNNSDFKKALDFSSKLVEVVIGFKHKGEILQYCFEEHENRQAELQEDS